MAAGGEVHPDIETMLQFATAAAIDAGHDPRAIRTWSVGDLLRYGIFAYNHRPCRR